MGSWRRPSRGAHLGADRAELHHTTGRWAVCLRSHAADREGNRRGSPERVVEPSAHVPAPHTLNENVDSVDPFVPQVVETNVEVV